MFVPPTGFDHTRRLVHSALPGAPVEPLDNHRPGLVTRLIHAWRTAAGGVVDPPATPWRTAPAAPLTHGSCE